MGTSLPSVALSSSSYGSLARSGVLVAEVPSHWKLTDVSLRGNWLPLIPMTPSRFGSVGGR